MYVDGFDKEIIDYLLDVFQKMKIINVSVNSYVAAQDVYEIRFENDEIVLQFYYRKEQPDCEAQVNITNILIQGNYKGKGISKKIINSLIDYCDNHGTMALLICDLINRSWCQYLLNKGGRLLQAETLYEGAIVHLPKKL